MRIEELNQCREGGFVWDVEIGGGMGREKRDKYVEEKKKVEKGRWTEYNKM